MNILNAIFLFLFGGVLASFLNLCVFRIEKNDSIKGLFIGRSFCDNCRKSLKGYELIPIFSFLFLKGKCSSCGKRISVFNLISELFLATTFLLFFLFEVPYFLFILLVLIYFFAVYDFHYHSIPKSITDIILILSFFYWFTFLLLDYDVSSIYPVLLVLFLWLLLFLFSRKKTLFGLGDILLLFIFAFWLEIELFLLVLFLSFFVGGIFSLFLVIKDKTYLKKYIPFIPFLFVGFVLACLSHYSSLKLFDYIFAIW